MKTLSVVKWSRRAGASNILCCLVEKKSWSYYYLNSTEKKRRGLGSASPLQGTVISSTYMYFTGFSHQTKMG
jgi:hypothetical protein